MFAFARTYLPHYFPLETPEFHRELMAHLEDIDEMKWFKTEVNPAFDPLQPYDEKTNWRVKKKVDSATGAHTPKEGIVLAAPRNHAKSTLFTLLLPIYCACFRTHRFIVIISDTHAQAESFANDIRAEFEENELIRRDFGDLNGAHWGKHWTIGDFVACHGEFDERGRRFIRHETRIVSRSSGSSMRGLRAREARPDLLVCHEQGTPVCVDGQWMKVEDHPTAQLVDKAGLEVRLSSLPNEEIVTDDHRYWTRRYAKTTYWRNRTAPTEGWCEARDLDPHSYIGTPIDRSVEPPASIPFYRPEIVRDPASGRVLSAKSGWEDHLPSEFLDPEWWWFFGLWWGDGHTSGRYTIGVTVADKDTETQERLKGLLDSWGIAFTLIPKDGCHQIVFSRAHLARWLKSWRSGNSRKQPPAWVERIDPRFQRELVRGYIAADGWVNPDAPDVRVTSVYLDGLLCLRRILARLGVAASIRRGIVAATVTIGGRTCPTQDKYDLRFRDGAANLGYGNIPDQDRYGLCRTFIDGDWLWTKVRDVRDAGTRTFVPIQTPDHTYLTHFGRSHNCDDLENEEHVETREQRDKLWTKFHGAIRNMMSPGAFFVVVGTILHFDSVLSRLLSQEYKDDYVQERYACTVGGVDVDDDRAKPIFPARWPLDQLRSRKATMPPKQFNSEYMNDPRDPSARDFRPEWFRFYHGRDLKRLQDGRTFWRDPRLPNAPRVREKQQWEELKQYQAVDPAISLEERADYFSIVAGGLTERTENIVVLWIVREHLAFAEQVQQIHSMAMTFPRTRLIGVEKVAFQDALRQAADGKAARRLSKTKIPLKGITHRSGPSNKESRLRRRSVDVMRGMVWLRRLDPGDPGYEEAPWDETHTVKIHPNHYLLYREMVDFPVGATDDVLDAFDMMVEIMGKRRLFEEFVKDAPQSRTRAQTKTLPFLEDLVLEAA